MGPGGRCTFRARRRGSPRSRPCPGEGHARRRPRRACAHPRPAHALRAGGDSREREHVRLALAPEPKLEFEPSLATSWKAVSDTQWEFKIRKGVRFHNGDIMTAEDVKYSFDRVLDPKKKSPQYGNIRAIKDVRVVDPETVVITTDKPFPLLLERLTFFCIVQKKHVESVGDQAFGTTAAVGTGPWKFVEWKRDQLIRLEAFDQHWR